MSPTFHAWKVDDEGETMALRAEDLDRTRQCFLREILSRPESDAPRLIYADWLDVADEINRSRNEMLARLIESHGLPPALAGQLPRGR